MDAPAIRNITVAVALLVFAAVAGWIQFHPQKHEAKKELVTKKKVVADNTAAAENNPTTAKSTTVVASVKVDKTPLKAPAGAIASYAEALAKITPAVVSVYPSDTMQGATIDGKNKTLDETLRHFYADNDRVGGHVGEKIPLGNGSGVIVTEDGTILTNFHVIASDGAKVAEQITVRLADGRELAAKVVGCDVRTDIAVLKIKASALPCATLADSSTLRVGDVVFAIGNPMRVGTTVTMGIISALGKSDLNIITPPSGIRGYENFIQTDASINPGNSGGALVDAGGRLIGINTAILSHSGSSVGIGFAIPVNMAHDVMKSILATGRVPRGYLGMRLKNIKPAVATERGLMSTAGALVDAVEKDSPADTAGLQHNDIITSINAQKIANAAELRMRIAEVTPGAKVEMTIVRDGKLYTAKATAGNLEEALSATPDNVGELLDGITVTPINEKLREKFEIRDDLTGGLIVLKVAEGGPYAKDFREGMVIIEANGKPANTLKEARGRILMGNNKLWVCYAGKYGFVAVQTK